MHTLPERPAASVRKARVAVVCESTACLPPELARDYGIGIIPIPFSFGEEEFLDGVNMSAAQFYERLSTAKTPPRTSAPAPGAYLAAWRSAAAGVDAVVLVTVDSKVSTMQQTALLARGLAQEAFGEVSIAVVDSLSAGMGQGFVALAAARAAADGRSLPEVIAAAEAVSRRVRLVVTLDTLEYLARNARIPQAAAWVGGLLAIKPVVQIAGGDIVLLERVRTRRRAVDALYAQVQKAVPEGVPLHAAVQHARAPEEAAAFAARLDAGFHCSELYISEFTPVMGGYCGPGLLGVAFYTADDLHAC